MPFGMKNAGSTFQKVMDQVLVKHRAYCRSYIDDVAVFSKTWEQHIKHLCVVFQTIQRVGFTINLKKCNFARRCVKFLGHVVGSGQHSPDPGKVESIKNVSLPTTKKEIRSFLGLTSYYREYIPNFASLVLPLTELTKNRVPNIIPWNEIAEQAFTKLKAQLVKAPSLYTPDLSKPYQLYTNASATAIGAC
ncbi:retrovirus-related Pol polyprotein from transposon 17.6 [Trichonephila clavipes]|nr:retrovirus-related Pol polyprotein from transposon 17.6 [Trichonephila clavipes]